MSETTTQESHELTTVIADAAVEIIREAREALQLPEGAPLSEAVAALAKFMQEWGALDTDVGGPFDDATYRATADELFLAIHKLRIAARRRPSTQD